MRTGWMKMTCWVGSCVMSRISGGGWSKAVVGEEWMNTMVLKGEGWTTLGVEDSSRECEGRRDFGAIDSTINFARILTGKVFSKGTGILNKGIGILISKGIGDLVNMVDGFKTSRGLGFIRIDALVRRIVKGANLEEYSPRKVRNLPILLR
jgi:hypothetical protein